MEAVKTPTKRKSNAKRKSDAAATFARRCAASRKFYDFCNAFDTALVVAAVQSLTLAVAERTTERLLSDAVFLADKITATKNAKRAALKLP